LDIGFITKIGSSHLASFGSLDGIKRAKAEIFQGIVPGGIAVVNTADPIIEQIEIKTDVRIIKVDPQYDLDHAPSWVGSKVVLEDLNFAVQIVQAAGIDERAITEALRFEPQISSHRLKLLDWGQAQILDDSYNASPESMAAALETLARISNGRRKVALLGTMLELGPESIPAHRKLGSLAGQLGVEHLAVIGKYSSEIVEGFLETSSGRYETLESLESVERFLDQLQNQSDLILVKASYGIKLWTVIEKLARKR
jgi:UDP-N-acetylmuramoyl-tripeptide--D-alanyl-D-alanine ligase